MTWRGALAAIALVVGSCGNAQPVSEPSAQTVAVPMQRAIDDIDALLSAAVQTGFGGAVIIQQGDHLLMAKGYGFANRDRRIPFETSTIAQIGSITKSQTGAAIATLIAEGKVSLHAQVGRYIPEAPEPGRSRTIAQLLSHSSGLLDICGNDFARMSEAKLVSDCLARPLAHPPGEDHYSNTGYSVLALVAQRVTGKPWQDLVRTNVWAPMGLRDIGFYFSGRSDDRFARGYLNNVTQPVISRSVAKLGGEDWALRGNGGVQASAETMIRFLNGLLSPTGGLSPAARRQMLAPVPGQSGEVREGYGLAFRYDPQDKLVRMGHAGSDGTFFSYLGWMATNDVRLYFVGNNGEPQVKPLLQETLKRVLQLPPAQTGGGERGR